MALSTDITKGKNEAIAAILSLLATAPEGLTGEEIVTKLRPAHAQVWLWLGLGYMARDPRIELLDDAGNEPRSMRWRIRNGQ